MILNSEFLILNYNSSSLFTAFSTSSTFLMSPALSFAQISIFHDGISVSFLIPCGEAEDEILSAAFGDRAESDGTSYRLEPGISRKQVLVPAITDLLSAYPKE